MVRYKLKRNGDVLMACILDKFSATINKQLGLAKKRGDKGRTAELASLLNEVLDMKKVMQINAKKNTDVKVSESENDVKRVIC